MKKSLLLLIVVLFAGAMAAGYYFLFSKLDRAGNTVADNLFGWQYPVNKFPLVGPDLSKLAYSSVRDPGGIPEGLPVRLKIPIINVDSAIEDALITPDGRMDVPSGSVNVAWFALGPHPGQIGSAVIGGHFGINNGVKFVFYDLDKLKPGDKIYVQNDSDETLAFVVRSIKLFDRNADATPVFTSNDGLAHLNLITCEGVWNQINGTYPERRVVFTDAIAPEAIPAATITPATIPPTTAAIPSLTIGSWGAEVTALQTALVQNGFLKLPPLYAKGYYGTLTRAAVIKYQASVGLPKTGVFDSKTRAKLFPVSAAAKPTLPATALISTPTSSLNQVSTAAGESKSQIIRLIKLLFASPLDALITSLLVILITAMAFKIIKKQ